MTAYHRRDMDIGCSVFVIGYSKKSLRRMGNLAVGPLGSAHHFQQIRKIRPHNNLFQSRDNLCPGCYGAVKPQRNTTPVYITAWQQQRELPDFASQ